MAATTITITRDNWTGTEGTVIVHEDGDITVEGIGRFRFEDRECDLNDGSKYDAFLWQVFSADGQWSEDHALAGGCRFRGDSEDAAAEANSCGLFRDSHGFTGPYAHRRAVAVARVLWNTV